MRSLEEHCKAAKEKAKQQQRKRRMEVRKTARRRRIAVVDFLAANRELLDQIKAEAFGESTEYHSPGDAVDF